MGWPQSQEYNEAIQSPSSSFADPELRTGEVVTNALGLPVPYSGNFADVYQIRCPNGSRWAVKCFTREGLGLRERYQEISLHLSQAKLPFTVEFTYLEQGIRIQGRWYPVLKMQWVEGFTLNDFIRQQLDKPAMLGALLNIWGKMATRLREAGIAHADLQHGNVLLVPGATTNSLALKLIDYDGMFVPALAGTKSGEVGHPAYQHPQRLREGTYSLEVDRFPLLSIAASLRCLKVGGRALWEKYDNGDNLLFKEADLREPGSSALFAELQGLGEPLVAAVQKALAGNLEEAPLLDEIMSETRPAAAAVPAPPPAKPKSAPPTPVPTKAAQAVQATVVPTANAWAFDKAASGKAKATRSQAKSGKMSGLVLAALAGGAAALLLLVGTVAVGAVIYLKGHGSNKVASTDSAHGKNSAATDKQSDKSGSDGGKPDKGRAIIPVIDPPDKGPTSKPLLPIKPDPPESLPPAGGTPPQQPKPAVPDEAAQAAAEKAIKEEHKDEYAKKKPADIQALASLLRRKARDSQRKPETRFVLLREARDLAARAGDTPLSLQVADEMADRFAVDAFEMKAAALQAAVPTAVPAVRLNLAVFALSIADDAAEVDDYAPAEHLVQVALAYTRGGPSSPVSAAAKAQQRELADLRPAYEQIQDAVRALPGKPNDPQVNLAVGRFYALTKGDWERGLVLLAHGSDAKLKDLAVTDLAIPTSAEAAVDLGDRYRTQANSESGAARMNLLCRACHWYEQAGGALKEAGRNKMVQIVFDIDKNLPLRPVILYARYGAFQGWADATANVRARVLQSPGQHWVFKGGGNELGIEDPAFGEHKTLIVVYRYRGGVHLSVTGDNVPVSIPAQRGTADTVPGRPSPGQELTILYVRYGADNTFATPTEKFQAAVNGATLTANADQLGIADPFPNRHKALIIVYRDGGGVHLSVTPQAVNPNLKAVSTKP